MIKRKDEIELPKHFYSYFRVCNDMQRNGLTCFDANGNYGGRNGEILILGILIIFEQLEMYKDCAFLRDFLVEFRNRFSPNHNSTGECNQSPMQDLKILLSHS